MTKDDVRWPGVPNTPSKEAVPLPPDEPEDALKEAVMFLLSAYIHGDAVNQFYARPRAKELLEKLKEGEDVGSG